MPHPVLDAAESFKSAARRREASIMRQLAETYAATNRELRAEVTAIVEFVRVNNRRMTPDEIRRLVTLDILARRTEEELTKYARYADDLMIEAMRAEIAIAMQDSEALVQAYFSMPHSRVAREIAASWVRLPTEAIESLIGMTNPASPLHTAIVGRLGREVADHMIDRMVQGIAQGKNPRVIARQVLGEGLTWAMTTVRTAQLNAYRYATRENYRMNRDVVSGWKWLATLDNRTCVSCLVMHGTVHGVDDVLNDHHNGRCTQIPIVPLATQLGIPEVELPSAESWLRRKSKETQQKIMGVGIWSEWTNGRVPWGELTSTYVDPIYGTMRRAPTLTQVRAEQ